MKRKKSMTHAVIMVIAVFMICALTMAFAFAETNPYEVSLKGSCPKAYSTRITVEIDKNPGIFAFEMGIQYPEDFTVTDHATLTNINEPSDRITYTDNTSKNPYLFSWIANDNNNEKKTVGKVATLEFTYDDTLVPGEYEFSFSKCKFTDASLTTKLPKTNSVKILVGIDQNYDGTIDEDDVKALRNCGYMNTVANTDSTRYDLNRDGYINETDVEFLREFE